MFPSSYGLFGSILSTDGMLSRVNVYEIGIPKTALWRQMKRKKHAVTISREAFMRLTNMCGKQQEDHQIPNPT